MKIAQPDYLGHLKTWPEFVKHIEAVKSHTLLELFDKNFGQAEDLTFHGAGLSIDFSKNHITRDTPRLFSKLCQSAKLSRKIMDMFEGEAINLSEDRAVLHTALRQQDDTPVIVGSTDIIPAIRATQKKMADFVNAVFKQKWTGYTNKAITDVVNIGIGGSDLGPKMVVQGLRPFHQHKVNVHFAANVDSSDLIPTLAKLNPETTLFIIASKTFTTQETLLNATSARQWLLTELKDDKAVAKHFVAVTSAIDNAVNFGIAEENCFAMWDFVGGRYSLWSAIGLPIMFAVGPKHFHGLLKGAAEMDTHFKNTPFDKNLPILMAMIQMIYGNICELDTHAIIPYANDLKYLADYLQQAEMESNGKLMNIEGSPVQYATSPIIWGGVGTNGQHAYHQLLHQGRVTVPVDFILPMRAHDDQLDHQLALVANCLAQSQALMCGAPFDVLLKQMLAEGYEEIVALGLIPQRMIPGNKPSTTIVMDQLTPETLGALIALYEHKIFVLSILWRINAFDQWGVELGKKLGKPILAALKGDDRGMKHMDDSTLLLIETFWQMHENANKKNKG